MFHCQNARGEPAGDVERLENDRSADCTFKNIGVRLMYVGEKV